MKLNVLERILLQNTLPKTGNFVTMKTVRTLHETLEFSEEEAASAVIVDDGKGSINWSNNIETEIEFTPGQIAVCVNVLRTLDDNEKLTLQHLSLGEKFLED